MPGALQVGEGDFFWEMSGPKPFQEVVTDIDQQILKYKQVRAIHPTPRQTGFEFDQGDYMLCSEADSAAQLILII